MLFQATKLEVICYSSKRKLIHHCEPWGGLGIINQATCPLPLHLIEVTLSHGFRTGLETPLHTV